MKPEAQLIALLTWMGWSAIRDATHRAFSGQLTGVHPEHGRCTCPPLTLDLMHEAEKRLNPSADLGESPIWDEYIHNLHRCGGDTHGFHSTKEQRLEALLKTIGEWKEEESAVLA